MATTITQVPHEAVGRACAESYFRHRDAYKTAEAERDAMPWWRFAARQAKDTDRRYYLDRAAFLSGIIMEAELISKRS